MLTTFENVDRQHRRRTDRERHLHAIDEIVRNSDILSAGSGCSTSNMNDVHAAAVDVLAGQPLAKREPELQLSTEENDKSWRERLPKRVRAVMGAAIVVLVVLLIVVATTMRNSKHAPAEVGDLGPKASERYEELLAQLQEWGVSNATWEDEESASWKALQWLAFEDLETEHVDTIRTRFALATLYYSTFHNTSTWKDSKFWLTSYPVCYWHGIDCVGNDDDNITLVKGLNLSSNNLIGTLPPEVTLLAQDVEILDLSYNYVWGSIPYDIGRKMVNLRQLYLGPNRLSSVIPETLFELSHLTHLYLDSCQLSGTLPPFISLLSNLQGLAMHDNYLSGTIPPEIGQLTALRVLNLDVNALTGSIPSTIGNLKGLVDLRLNNNLLTDAIPAEFSNLRILEVLYLGDNKLTGLLGVLDFKTMPVLGDVQLHNNNLVGTIPESIGYLALLQVLYLDSNLLDGMIPVTLGNDFFLEQLYLSNNKFSGPIPTELGRLHKLVQLRIDENQLTGPLPTELGSLFELNTLLVNNNTLNGGIPLQLGQLPKLQDARFHGNLIAGFMPSILCHNSSTAALSVLTADCSSNKVSCSCCTTCFE
ncbi:hypothetical protein ACA910_018184 [Epithemia clementina (nom. ined.)]